MKITVPLSTNLSAPVIETERLRLRPHQIDDLPDCVAMWADAEIARFTIGEPSPPTRTWARLLAYRGHWAMMGFGYWAIEEKRSGRFVGEFGFADFKRDQYHEIQEMPELGWVLASHAHGHGYSTEGLRAIVAWADTHFNNLCTACIIRNDNHRSFHVAERLGFRAIPNKSVANESETLLVRPVPANALA